MKKFSIPFRIMAAVALLAFTAPMLAGDAIYAPQTLASFTCAASTATNLAYVIDARKQASVTVQFTTLLSTSATDAQTYRFSRSVDGINYAPIQESVAITPTASTKTVLFTNLSAQGCGYIKIYDFTNAAASATSTNTIVYGVKIQAP